MFSVFSNLQSNQVIFWFFMINKIRFKFPVHEVEQILSEIPNRKTA
jgi:hypothetical protein